ncbi:MAG: hypothetical protein QMD10_11635 [Desulfitobacteriaceae bacterium]|nr:hypothetical protein [Desulfitobacteriaceae bacterium]
MPVINFLGTDLYIQMKPTFRGARAPVLKKVPYTADNPTTPQRKARAWLARKAFGKRDTFGTVADTGHGKAGPKIAREIYDMKPGKTVHGGLKTLRDYAIARRKPESRIRELEAEAGA